MSSLDKDSGVRPLPTIFCPKCNRTAWYTASGILIHFDIESRC